MLNKHSILCVGYYTWKPRTSYVKSNSEFQNYEISFDVFIAPQDFSDKFSRLLFTIANATLWCKL
jgi:hypothetical protein